MAFSSEKKDSNIVLGNQAIQHCALSKAAKSLSSARIFRLKVFLDCMLPTLKDVVTLLISTAIVYQTLKS